MLVTKEQEDGSLCVQSDTNSKGPIAVQRGKMPKVNESGMPVNAKVYRQYEDTVRARISKADEFIDEAYACCCAGTMTLKDVFDILPMGLPFSCSPMQAYLYEAMYAAYAHDEQCTPAIIWEEIVRLRYDAVFPKNWLFDHELSPYSLRRDVIPLFGSFVRREAAKEICANKLVGLYTACHTYGPLPYEISSRLRELADKLEKLEPDSEEDSSLFGIGQRLLKEWEAPAQAPIPTPWMNLNDVLGGGLTRGELAILAARPSMGKTAYAGAMMMLAAKMDYSVLMISREMSDTSMLQRIIASETGLNLSLFRQRNIMTPEEQKQVRITIQNLGKLHCNIRERSTSPMTPAEVERIINLSQPKVDLLIVDYLQLMQPDVPSKSREQDVASMARAFKQIALKHQIPVLLLAQLNRQSEMTAREPRLSDLRESGAIEQDADIVMLIHSPEDHMNDLCRQQKIIVAKGRSSGTGEAWTAFDRQFCRVYESQAPIETPNDRPNRRRV